MNKLPSIVAPLIDAGVGDLGHCRGGLLDHDHVGKESETMIMKKGGEGGRESREGIDKRGMRKGGLFSMIPQRPFRLQRLERGRFDLISFPDRVPKDRIEALPMTVIIVGIRPKVGDFLIEGRHTIGRESGDLEDGRTMEEDPLEIIARAPPERIRGKDNVIGAMQKELGGVGSDTIQGRISIAGIDHDMVAPERVQKGIGIDGMGGNLVPQEKHGKEMDGEIIETAGDLFLTHHLERIGIRNQEGARETRGQDGRGGREIPIGLRRDGDRKGESEISVLVRVLPKDISLRRGPIGDRSVPVGKNNLGPGIESGEEGMHGAIRRGRERPRHREMLHFLQDGKRRFHDCGNNDLTGAKIENTDLAEAVRGLTHNLGMKPGPLPEKRKERGGAIELESEMIQDLKNRSGLDRDLHGGLGGGLVSDQLAVRIRELGQDVGLASPVLKDDDDGKRRGAGHGIMRAHRVGKEKIGILSQHLGRLGKNNQSDTKEEFHRPEESPGIKIDGGIF